MRTRAPRGLGAFALACVAIAAALLTRQAFVWLVPVAAVFLLRADLRAPGRLLAGGAMLVLALVPLGLLALDWNGLVPPSADPASCGLCEDRQGLAREALTLRTIGFTIALAGAYGALVFGPGLVRRLQRLRSSMFARAYLGLSGRADAVRRGIAAALAAGVLLLVISPLLYKPITPQQAGDAGYLWQLSDRLPELFGSSLLFWLLVPLGCVVLYLLVWRAGIWSLPAVYLVCFLLAALPVRLVYQKYFDPFMLLALALLGAAAGPADALGLRRDRGPVRRVRGVRVQLCRLAGLEGEQRDALDLVGAAGVERALGGEAVVVLPHLLRRRGPRPRAPRGTSRAGSHPRCRRPTARRCGACAP